ncbi:hypothetical protein [Acaryochloris marina]|uniref:hypothetical protein n=1 Tax=Acaryochloris marina TaxID=155978 RepID=UPI00164F62A0|nr:hypothetical protein [Acaryochloris marina]BDM79352.1 hypothetical protein AM10699_22200 [Acaryochloris marina MBIC10699]
MESQKNPIFRKITTSESLMHYLVIGAAFIIFLGCSLFRTTSIQIDCDRYISETLQCAVTRRNLVLTMSPVKIPKPIAVDIIDHHGDCDGCNSYALEMRSASYSFAVPLYLTENFEVAKQLSTDVNNFLLHSQESSFSKRYP